MTFTTLRTGLGVKGSGNKQKRLLRLSFREADVNRFKTHFSTLEQRFSFEELPCSDQDKARGERRIMFHAETHEGNKLISSLNKGNGTYTYFIVWGLQKRLPWLTKPANGSTRIDNITQEGITIAYKVSDPQYLIVTDTVPAVAPVPTELLDDLEMVSMPKQPPLQPIQERLREGARQTVQADARPFEPVKAPAQPATIKVTLTHPIWGERHFMVIEDTALTIVQLLSEVPA